MFSRRQAIMNWVKYYNKVSDINQSKIIEISINLLAQQQNKSHIVHSDIVHSAIEHSDIVHSDIEYSAIERSATANASEASVNTPVMRSLLPLNKPKVKAPFSTKDYVATTIIREFFERSI